MSNASCFVSNRQKIGYQIAREQKASDIITLKEELRNLLIDIDHYGRTIKAKKAQLASAQKSLKLVSTRYKEGLATYIEVLDTNRSVSVVKMLKKIALDQDVAIIMVTHDEAMLPLCDRILKIENKKVVSHDVPSNGQLAEGIV